MTKLTSSLQIAAFSFTVLAAPVALANDAAKETQQTQVATQGMSHEEWKHAHKEFKAKQKAEKEEFKAQQKKTKEDCKAKLKEAREEFKAKQKAEKEAFHSMKR